MRRARERRGTTEERGVLDEMGWYGDNSGGQTHPVALKQPNAWGLYDMQGNVFEWVEDWYGPYSGEARRDPIGPTTGSYRVLRGGSWHFYASAARSAYRLVGAPTFRSSLDGFRLARTP